MLNVILEFAIQIPYGDKRGKKYFKEWSPENY